jgi:tight adherence protein B
MGLFLLIFVVSLAVVGLVMYGVTSFRWNPEQRTVHKQLRQLVAERGDRGSVDITRQRRLSGVPLLNQFLLNLKSPHVQTLDRLVLQSGSKFPLGLFILLTCVLAMGGFLVMTLFTRNVILPLLVGLVLGCLPYYYLQFRKNQRLNKLQEQLPDALDMVARALKAGHALSGGFQMVALEFQDPINTEFHKLIDEINFGVSYEDALRNLSNRIDSADVKFFSMSVIIQKQSGGNLAEILESIGRLIRERLKLKGRIRVLSAEARLSAVILVVLPFVIVTAMAIINPRYLPTLLNDPVGHVLMAVSITMMIIGIVFIKRMIAIKV